MQQAIDSQPNEDNMSFTQKHRTKCINWILYICGTMFWKVEPRVPFIAVQLFDLVWRKAMTEEDIPLYAAGCVWIASKQLDVEEHITFYDLVELCLVSHRPRSFLKAEKDIVRITKFATQLTGTIDYLYELNQEAGGTDQTFVLAWFYSQFGLVCSEGTQTTPEKRKELAKDALSKALDETSFVPKQCKESFIHAQMIAFKNGGAAPFGALL